MSRERAARSSRRFLAPLCILATFILSAGSPSPARSADSALGAVAAVDAGLEPAPAAACSPGASRLCVTNQRFRVTASWRTADNQTGQATAVPLTGDTGYFWFFQNTNVELIVKVLDACSAFRHYWVFATGLTNVQVDLTVEDTVTGQTRTYRNPQNRTFAPIQDTGTFPCAPRRDALSEEAATAPSLAALAGPLSLNHGRFQVSVDWQTPQGATGSGQPVQLTDETGYFWFFQQSNVEMIVKVLDACSFADRYWVFTAGLTNVRVDITVRDTETGAVKTYRNPQNTPFQTVLDTSAFATCQEGGLPPDPGSAGRQTLAGIDSDRDGLRDDLQRYIALTYPSAQSTQTALQQMTRMLQGAVLDAASHDRSLDHATDLVRAAECLHAVRSADADQVETALLAQALNTEARGLAYLQYNDQLAGATFPLKPRAQWSSSCGSRLASGVMVPGLGRAADAASTCLPAEGTTVFFGNGVWNTCEEANQSALFLADAAQSVLSSEEYARTSFQMSCNPTRGWIADVWRATKQRFSSDFSAFIRALGNIDPMPDFLQQALVDQADEIISSAAVADPTLRQHIDTYNREILEGRKVVVVAHSQGNFYANLAYQGLVSQYQPSFGIVSVANPDSYVAGDGPYTTLHSDKIITGSSVPFALDANTTNSPNPDSKDGSGHAFLASYMPAGSRSRGQILGDLRDQIAALEPPDNPAGNGIITITLNWGAQPDVDLHVFEPDGTHVYWVNQEGDVGFLDVDDVSGFGPEHYFVSCDTLTAGTYQVGVNYYQGSAPETARVQIQAGLEVRSFQTTLTSARGSSGDGTPIPVADIVVTGSAATGFHFDIIPR